MIRFLSVVVALLLTPLPALAENESEMQSGDIYATVDMMPNGDIEVVEIRSDLPERMNPRIEDWLRRQAIHLAATADGAEAPNRTVVQVGYAIVDDPQRGRGLVMIVKGTGVGVPENLMQPASYGNNEIRVRVRVLADGSVAAVMPLSELPDGVELADIETAVREDIENDPAIQQAAAEGRLQEAVHTLTVRPPPEN